MPISPLQEPHKGNYKKTEFVVTDNGCFEVVSHSRKRNSGYTYIQRNRKAIGMHRFIYEQCFGEISEDKIILHSCDNPMCINPEHLKVGTQQDNIADMVAKNRQRGAVGENNWKARLKEQQVIEIIASGQDYKVLAKKYNTTLQAIYAIKSGKSWKHIPQKRELINAAS